MRSFKNSDEALRFLESIPWGNAAGTCRRAEIALDFAEIKIPAVMFGSITKEERMGNMGGNFSYNPETGNSKNNDGLTNGGIKKYMDILPGLRQRINKEGSKLWVSISAGENYIPDEYKEMGQTLVISNAADVMEGNFSCPNVLVGGKRKIPICFSLDDFRKGVRALREGASGIPIAAKISPIIDECFLGRLTDICIKENVNYIVCSNTKNSRSGGLGGQILKPLVSRMIQIISPLTRGTNTKIIAVGGIEKAIDAYNYLYWGGGEVVGFQFNTAFTRRNEDPGFIGGLIIGKDDEPGLVDLLVDRGLPW